MLSEQPVKKVKEKEKVKGIELIGLGSDENKNKNTLDSKRADYEKQTMIEKYYIKVLAEFNRSDPRINGSFLAEDSNLFKLAEENRHLPKGSRWNPTLLDENSSSEDHGQT